MTAKQEGVGNGLRRGDAWGGKVRESKSRGQEDGPMGSVISLSMLASTTNVGKDRVKFGPSTNWDQLA